MTVELLASLPGEQITRDGQLDWAGTLLGSGTPYRWLELTGWDDMPGLDSASVPRPNRHGAWSGQQLAQERIITWSARLSAPTPTDFGPLVAALRRATTILDNGREEPLVIRVKGGETLLTFAAVTSRIIPNTPEAGIGRGTVTLQWTATDPRRYSVLPITVPIVPTAAAGGLPYPLAYPLDYGTPGTPADATVTNDGDTATHPVLQVAGPVTTPRIINQTAGSILEFGVVLGAGETLDIDCGAGTVLLNGISDRFATMTAESGLVEDFVLVPGGNAVSLRGTLSAGAALHVTWRHAYL